MSAGLTPTRIRDLCAAHGVSPSRALGQNFLADPNTAERIVREAGVILGDRVFEIGPGVGSLTVALADVGADVLALELDRHLLPVLTEAVGGVDESRAGGRVRIEQGDALDVDLEDMLVRVGSADTGASPDAPIDRDRVSWKVISNLPYNMAVPIIIRVLEEAPSVASLFVMVQSEVADRLAAEPGTKAYGAVTVKVDYHAHCERVGSVPPTVFIPRPNVESALVRLVRRDTPAVEVDDPAAMFALVRAGFAQRRKTLGRALRPLMGDRAREVLVAAGIDPAERAERLELTRWAALATAAGSTEARERAR